MFGFTLSIGVALRESVVSVGIGGVGREFSAAGGAETGGSWQRQAPAEGDGGSESSNNGGVCWSRVGWQQQAKEGSRVCGTTSEEWRSDASRAGQQWDAVGWSSSKDSSLTKTGGGSDRSADGGSSCFRLREAAAQPAQPITITVCADRWQGGGRDGKPGLKCERQESELAERHSQGSELAERRSQGSELVERRSQVSELAERASGCRTVKSGCRTVSAQAVHISIDELWLSHWKGPQPSGCMSMVCVACECQCSLCFSRGLLQRTSQEALLKSTLVGTSMGQWVVER